MPRSGCTAGAMDFFLGEITREHTDIDWFAWAEDAGRRAEALARRGYEPLEGPPAEQQIDFGKGDDELSFALPARDASGRFVVGGGPWAGEPWPDGMLDAAAGAIGDVRCRVISAEARIEIRLMMPVRVPGMPRRAKDGEDTARLRSALAG
ncbi:aminoglycoside adenylyltransferase [Streptomyces sp. NPDC002187]|uniref:aminoglycoside adenylyltransferase n=1 Tax=Streptomyces sp. NPDC002187 TaxID=3364637 RepID=UPI003686BF25